MRKNYDVVIIGGGIHGLALAYYLARDASQRVAVFEKQYLGSGASGRNGEMIRSALGPGNGSAFGIKVCAYGKILPPKWILMSCLPATGI